MDARLRIGQRVLLHEESLHEQIRRGGLLARQLADELDRFLVLGRLVVAVRRAQAVEQTGDEFVFLGGHG